ncbi:MAG: hypothetical protein IPM45_15595 [Acidimicrobiales bacterium]|nr:hypothetical protein [Acidimicrobiales bacterium]
MTESNVLSIADREAQNARALARQIAQGSGLDRVSVLGSPSGSDAVDEASARWLALTERRAVARRRLRELDSAQARRAASKADAVTRGTAIAEGAEKLPKATRAADLQAEVVALRDVELPALSEAVEQAATALTLACREHRPVLVEAARQRLDTVEGRWSALADELTVLADELAAARRQSAWAASGPEGRYGTPTPTSQVHGVAWRVPQLVDALRAVLVRPNVAPLHYRSGDLAPGPLDAA